jgi:hypothetical protein
MLSREVLEKVGVFNADTILPLIEKMKKSPRTSEVENMVLASVISTNLVHKQFIEGDYEVLTDDLILNSNIINDK